MPVYEYECVACGLTTEAMQKFSDDPLAVCPECGGRLKKLISNSSFVLKGTGWYVTDYARKGSQYTKDSVSKEEAKTSAGTTTESKSDSSKETKSDSSKETKPDSSKETKPEVKKEPASSS